MAHRSLELRVGDRITPLDPLLNLLFAGDEVARKNGRRGRDRSRQSNRRESRAADVHTETIDGLGIAGRKGFDLNVLGRASLDA